MGVFSVWQFFNLQLLANLVLETDTIVPTCKWYNQLIVAGNYFSNNKEISTTLDLVLYMKTRTNLTKNIAPLSRVSTIFKHNGAQMQRVLTYFCNGTVRWSTGSVI